MTKGRIGELFVFGLALFGINLVGAILCGIGLLFTYGITAIAVAYAYRTLRGEPVAPGRRKRPPDDHRATGAASRAAPVASGTVQVARCRAS